MVEIPIDQLEVLSKLSEIESYIFTQVLRRRQKEQELAAINVGLRCRPIVTSGRRSLHLKESQPTATCLPTVSASQPSQKK